MARMMILIAAALLLVGCDEESGTQSIPDSYQGQGRAYFIGTVDGCRLWSVNRGQFYFANCRGGPTSTGYQVRAGKTSHYHNTLTTYDD